MCDWALRSEKNTKNPALSAHNYNAYPTCSLRMSSNHIAYMGRAECFLTYSCLALAMRDVFVNFVALLTRHAVSKSCVFADLYTWFIYNTLYICLKIAGFSHYILTKFMDAQRRTTLVFVTQGVGCASCMCDWGIRSGRNSFCPVGPSCILCPECVPYSIVSDPVDLRWRCPLMFFAQSD